MDSSCLPTRWIQGKTTGGSSKGEVYSVFTVAPKAPSPPRINLEQPEQSLLLLKPTFAVPHGGGSLFSRGSEDYQTILDWVRNGAPFGQADARIERLDVFPMQPVLDLHGKQNLLVIAHRSGGRQADASGQARYESVDREVAEVSADGVIQAKKAGETPILIHVAGHAPVGIRVGIAANPLVEYPAVAGEEFDRRPRLSPAAAAFHYPLPPVE